MDTFRAVSRAFAYGAFVLGLCGILLMFIGDFTVEWTCVEVGSDWRCVGESCNGEANKRFDVFRRTVKCDRTDWPMAVLNRVGSILFPGSAKE
jgi:hypothetical protein